MLGDALAAALPELRAHAESRMGAANGGSTVNVHRRGAEGAQDEDTGLESPSWERVYTLIPGRIGGTAQGSSGTRTVSTPAGDVQLAVRTMHLPSWVSDLADGDLVEVVTGENYGSFWQVIESDWADQQTARRVPIVATSRPGDLEA